jgi:hypothetical protein
MGGDDPRIALIADQAARIEGLSEALRRIEKWFGEFPETDRKWDDGTPVSYGACWGSNGERDFMREVARAALEGRQPCTMPWKAR